MMRCNLPDQISLRNGATLKPVIGGHLENQPFLTTVDVTKNGWGTGLTESQTNQLSINEAKRRKLKYRVVKILSRNLRGKLDLHHRPYRPNVWVFVEVKRAEPQN